MNKIIFNLKQTEHIIEQYNAGLSCKEIGSIYNCSKQTINALLKNSKVELRDASHCQQKYKIDESVFEKIDSHEKAYWLGMITGDGTVSEDHELSFSLELNDEEYVYQLKNFFKAEHPVARVKNRDKKDGSPSISSHFYISNKKIVSELNALGVLPNKTKFMSWPDIDAQYFPSYMLGLVDSDGCFCLKNVKRRNDKALSFSFVGPTEFVEMYQNILIEKCNISRTKFDVQKNTDFIRVVCYSGYKNIYKIIKFLYSTPIRGMKRKRDVAINFLLTKYPEDKWLADQLTR